MSSAEPSAVAERPIFVIGCARSGTTLLQLMLHAHPRIAVPPETRHLIPLYDARERFGDLRDPTNVDRLIDWLLDGHRKRLTRDLGIDLDELRTRAHQVDPTVGGIAGLCLQMYAERFGKPRWGDKRPGYFRRLDALLAMFPDAQLIHLIRDGRDCVASLKTMRWWSHGSIGAMHYWVAAMRTGARARRRLRADQFYELRYEDLVTEPQATLEGLCAFLGEEFDEAMLEPREVAPEAVPKRKRARHHRRLVQSVDGRAIGRWSDDLVGWELRLMEWTAARRLRGHGYELSTGRRRLPAPLPWARYVARGVWLSGLQLRHNLGRWRRARRYPYPVAAGTAVGRPGLAGDASSSDLRSRPERDMR